MSPKRPDKAAYSLPELLERHAAAGERWLEFIDTPTLRAGIYALSAGSEDPQSPHDEDEVYYVIRGRAKLRIDGEEHAAQPGTSLFVAAHVPHRFVAIAEDLVTLVFFSKAPPAPA